MKSKKRMGRPPVKNPRSVMFNFRVTVAEARALRAAARAAGLSLSAHIMAPHRKGR